MLQICQYPDSIGGSVPFSPIELAVVVAIHIDRPAGETIFLLIELVAGYAGCCGQDGYERILASGIRCLEGI